MSTGYGFGGFFTFSTMNPRETLNQSNNNGKRVIPVRMAAVRILDLLRRSSPIAGGLMRFVRSWIQAWHIQWKTRDQVTSKVFKDAKNEAHLVEQFSGLPQSALVDFLSFGFCVVRYVRTKKLGLDEEDLPIYWKPEVMEPNLYDVVLFHDVGTGVKTYEAFHFNRSPVPISERKPIPNTRVYIYNHPDPTSGQVNSPLVTAYEALQSLEESLTLTLVAQDKMAFPLTNYSKTGEDVIMKDNQMNTNHVMASELSDAQSRRHHELQNAEISKLNLYDIGNSKLDLEITKEQRSSDLIQQAELRNLSMFSSRTKFLQLSRQMAHIPSFRLPLSIEANAGPESKALQGYLEFQNALRAEIAYAFGIPESALPGSGSKFAADVALTKVQIELVTREWQKSLSPVLIRTYMDLYYNNIVAELGDEIESRVSQEAKRRGGNDNDPQVRRAKMTISEKLHRGIIKRLEFSVFFEKISLNEPEYIRMLFDDNIIDFAEYQNQMLSIGNVPQSSKNANAKPPPTKWELEERRMQLEERTATLKMQQKSSIGSKSQSAPKRQKIRATDDGTKNGLKSTLKKSDRKLNKGKV